MMTQSESLHVRFLSDTLQERRPWRRICENIHGLFVRQLEFISLWLTNNYKARQWHSCQFQAWFVACYFLSVKLFSLPTDPIGPSLQPWRGWGGWGSPSHVTHVIKYLRRPSGVESLSSTATPLYSRLYGSVNIPSSMSNSCTGSITLLAVTVAAAMALLLAIQLHALYNSRSLIVSPTSRPMKANISEVPVIQSAISIKAFVEYHLPQEYLRLST